MFKDIRPALRSLLLSDSAIAAQVAQRIHSIRLPAGAPVGPAIVYSLISESTDHHMQGSSGLVSSRFQIDAWSTSADTANNLALLIKERMDGFQGPMGDVIVRGVFSENARNDYDAAANLHRASRDFFLHYAER